jgi:hypothetical protein
MAEYFSPFFIFLKKLTEIATSQAPRNDGEGVDSRLPSSHKASMDKSRE